MTTEQAIATVTSQLIECENQIANGWTEMASALMRIRDEKLYEQQYATFEDYCRERWGYDRSYSQRLMRASETLKLIQAVPIGTVAPQNEAQIRPLTKLPKEKRVDAWQEAAKSAPKAEDGHPLITAKHVEGVVQKLLPEEAKRPTPPPPTQDVVDLREIKKAARVFKELAYGGDRALERYGADALGEDVLFAAQWFSDLWYAHRGNVDVSIPLQDGSYYHPAAADVEQWQKAYPALDVMEQLRKCAAWNDANPAKRKTHKGIKKHIVYWLNNQKPDTSNADAEDRAVML